MTDAPLTAETAHTADLLFAAPVQSRETDERYTPAWIFEALGETFDLDPASPPLGVSQVPTAAVWTKDDDGLTQPCLSMHGYGPRAVAALRRFADRQPAAGVLLERMSTPPAGGEG